MHHGTSAWPLDERPSSWPHASRKFTLQRTRGALFVLTFVVVNVNKLESEGGFGAACWLPSKAAIYVDHTEPQSVFISGTALPYIARIERKKLSARKTPAPGAHLPVPTRCYRI